MSNKKIHLLRPEARPMAYNKLQWRVKEVLLRIVNTLKEAKEGTQNSDALIDGLDKSRASRLFFVSGEPGCGKSTMYCTLKAMLGVDDSNKYLPSKEDDPIHNDIKSLRESVCWLESIDLEVTEGEHENMLAAVLVRLFAKLDKPDTFLSKKCEEAINELEELASDIGIAWDGNLRDRAAALDPDSYSAEVMRAQRAKLGVNERLWKALDKLAANKCCGCSQSTLFILPIDDFYLKPVASLQLLRLLRMISIPRLFFLIMGDITSIEALFMEKCLKDWTKIAGIKTFAVNNRLDEALSYSREMRSRYLRKLLPLGQRATLETMDWFEALDFEMGRAPSEGDVTLESLLKKIELSNKRSLCDFLVLPLVNDKNIRKEWAKPGKQYKKDKKRKTVEAYTALQILDATPREIMDLGIALAKLGDGLENGQNDMLSLLFCISDLINQVKAEQNFLNDKQQKRLDTIGSTRHYDPDTFFIDMKCLSLEPNCFQWKKLGDYYYRRHISWTLAVNDEKNNQGTESEPFAKLPPRPAAWYILLHDLAVEWNEDSVEGNLVTCLGEKIANAEASNKNIKKSDKTGGPPKDYKGWAYSNKINEFKWPNFKKLRELDQFLYVWNTRLDWLEKLDGASENKKKDMLVKIWSHAKGAVEENCYENFLENENQMFEDIINPGGSKGKGGSKKE